MTQATHRQGKLAVAPISEQGHARDMVEDGVDGLVHVFLDQRMDPAFVRLAVAKRIFVVPTLSVWESFITTAGGESILADPDPDLASLEIEALLTPAPPSSLTLENLAIAKENVRRLHQAGIPILTGTDAITHGISLHRDLELLVESGLTPLDALTGATSAAADAFRLRDRGRIAPGLRADLLLVDGDPTRNIKATRRIEWIWKGGVEVERELPAPKLPH